MKDNKGKLIPKPVFQDTPSAAKLLADINDLSVEDLIVGYAYAEAIVETVREPLVILDKNLHIKTANKSFFETFKVNKKDTYNKPIFELGNGQWDIPELKKLLLEVLPKDNHLFDFEVHHEFEDIGEKIMLLNARRIILENQHTHLILLAIEDVTEKKRLEHQKDDFIAIASHEFKTPLTSIKILLQVLKSRHKKAGDDPSVAMLSKIEAQVTRLTDMMASFLSVYKMQTSSMELHKTSLSVTKLVDEVVETFQYITETHTIVRTGSAKKKLRADKERLEQVLINLISNAIKYSPDGEKVVVSVKEDAKHMYISVQDFGVGIPKDKQDKIYNRFYRVEGPGEKPVDGVGLGLFISNEIVKEHGGTILLKSAKNTGSTFTVCIPLLAKKQKEVTAS